MRILGPVGWLSSGLLALAFACSEPSGEGGDTQTNWLRACGADSDCGSLSCLCGVCSRSCSSESDCDGGPAGVACQSSDSASARAACGSTPSSGMCLRPLAQATTPLDFCTEFYTAMCDHVERCSCGDEAAADCRTNIEGCPTNAFFAELAGGVEAGSYEYDSAAAAALFARLRDPEAGCEGQTAALGFDSYSAHTFGGVFRGTLAAGSSCEGEDNKKNAVISRCGEGLLCLPDTGGTNRCVAIAAPGDACPVVSSDPDSNCLERRPPDNDGEFESAFSGLVCLPDGAGSSMGTCARLAPDGTACDSHEQCASGRCFRAGDDFSMPGTCTARLADAEPCTVGADCASGRCAFDAGPQLCAARLPDGTECTFGEDCASGFCTYPGSAASSGTCGPDAPPAPLSPGSACSEGDDCGRGLCSQGRCLEPICVDYIE